MSREIKILAEKPPVWDRIIKAFPEVLRSPGIVFAYEGCIFVPNGSRTGSVTLPEAILAHERVHLDRQNELPGGPEEWWDRYLLDQGFRFEEELLAHCIEYEFLAKLSPSRTNRRLFLKHVSEKLSSEIYGPMCNRSQAKASIKQLLEDIKKT